MPGKPLQRRFEDHIEKLGGDQVVFDQIAGGATMEEVASSFRGFIDDRPDFPSRSWMYVWINADYVQPERREAWKEAKEIAAHALVDEAGDILDNDGEAPVTSAEMQWLKQRAEHAKWRAKKFNPKEYGDETKQGVNVNLDIGNLHLEALRSAGSMKQLPTEEDPPMLEAEVVEES